MGDRHCGEWPLGFRQILALWKHSERVKEVSETGREGTSLFHRLARRAICRNQTGRKTLFPRNKDLAEYVKILRPQTKPPKSVINWRWRRNWSNMPFLNAATSKLRNLYSCLSRWLEGYATATRVDSVENSHCLQEFEECQTWRGPQPWLTWNAAFFIY